MRSMLKLLFMAIAVLLLPASVEAQCSGTCEGACLRAATDAFVKSTTENRMFLMPVEEFARTIDEADSGLVVLDVRPAPVYARGHIAGSVNVPLPALVEQMESLPADRKIAVVCAIETRSAFAVAILRMHGRDAWIVEGGVHAWAGLGRELIE